MLLSKTCNEICCQKKDTLQHEKLLSNTNTNLYVYCLTWLSGFHIYLNWKAYKDEWELTKVVAYHQFDILNMLLLIWVHLLRPLNIKVYPNDCFILLNCFNQLTSSCNCYDQEKCLANLLRQYAVHLKSRQNLQWTNVPDHASFNIHHSSSSILEQLSSYLFI